MWNTPCRFDSVCSYSTCLPCLSKAQQRKHTHTQDPPPPSHAHILDLSFKLQRCHEAELTSCVQFNVLWFKGVGVTISAPWNNPRLKESKATHWSANTTTCSLKSLSSKRSNMKCSVQPFGPMITDNGETSKYTGYKAGQCSALLTDCYKMPAAGAGTCILSLLQAGWRTMPAAIGWQTCCYPAGKLD